MRLAYADPPYPGKAHLYPENTEVDHAELIQRLCEYDGWALSTDETNLAGVLALCPAGVRVLAWCVSDAFPTNRKPWASWEPVIAWPARTDGDGVRSFYVCPAPPRGFCGNGTALVGAKPAGFCEWVIRCLGAREDDTLEDVFPGTGIMGETWERFKLQPPLFTPPNPSMVGSFQIARKTHPQLPGMPEPVVARERNDYSAATC